MVSLFVFRFSLQLKRKRVGAGLRGFCNSFVSAKDLLMPSMSDTEPNKGMESGGFFGDCPGVSDIKPVRKRTKETNAEKTSAVSSSIRARANAVSAPLSSPTKGSRAASKKQQRLAEAAKSSRNISQFFTKTPTMEKSWEEAEMFDEVDGTTSPVATGFSEDNISPERHSPAAVEAAEGSPVASETHDVIIIESETEIIVIPDNEEEEADEVESLKLVQTASPPDTTVITE